tara:strand:+ start:155 stop:514 length:360 start_codon:yes stop_codon:yes gene_type:complete
MRKTRKSKIKSKNCDVLIDLLGNNNKKEFIERWNKSKKTNNKALKRSNNKLAKIEKNLQKTCSSKNLSEQKKDACIILKEVVNESKTQNRNVIAGRKTMYKRIMNRINKSIKYVKKLCS